MERTIGGLWRDAVARGSMHPAYLAERDGGWVEVSWPEAARRVDELANGLLALGIRKGDAFGILASTCLEWCLFDFALALVGAIGVPIYASSSPHDVAYVLEHSEAVGVLVEDAKRLGPAPLRHLLTFDDLDDLEARGREHAAAHPSALDDAFAAIDGGDLFTYIYTSGTTGPPKGCMIRHRNYYDMTAVFDSVPGLLQPDDTILLYLPLAHTFGRLLHLVAAYAGYTLAFCRDPLNIAQALPVVRPTIFPSVPRVYETVHTAVLSQLESAHGLRRRLGGWALRVGREASARRQEGRPLPPWLALRHRLADRLLFSKVKKRFGGRLRLAISGGAPISVEVLSFFHSLDILILEGYGLTECTTACSVNLPDRYRFGAVGPLLPGFEARIAEDGELLLRSDTVFAGYYRDEQATREAIDADGWLHTGDIGRIDEDGFLGITDRKKDILVTSGGKNVAPQNLENEIKASKYVSQALVVGDRRDYIAALITLNQAEIDNRGGDDVEELIRSVVNDVNRNHSRYEQIRRFEILPRDFSAEEGELTPTLKLRRRVVQEHFADAIERLYE